MPTDERILHQLSVQIYIVMHDSSSDTQAPTQSNKLTTHSHMRAKHIHTSVEAYKLKKPALKRSSGSARHGRRWAAREALETTAVRIFEDTNTTTAANSHFHHRPPLPNGRVTNRTKWNDKSHKVVPSTLVLVLALQGTMTQ